MSDVDTNQSDRPLPSGLLWLAALLGAIGGVLANRRFESVGAFGLLAAPFLFGVIAGLLRGGSPAFDSLKLSLAALLVATPLMGEGVVCLVIVVPWTLVLAPIVGLLTALVARRLRPSPAAKVLLLVLAFSANAAAPYVDQSLRDGSQDRVTFADQVEVAVPREVVWASLEQLHLDFTTPAPWLLHAGLPTPVRIEGGGATPGSERRVVFENGTVLATVTAARAPERFDIDLSVEASGPEFFDHWCVLERSYFELQALPGGRTRISHVTTYLPRAYPRWYFEPLERALGSVVQRYLLDAYAAELREHPPVLVANP